MNAERSDSDPGCVKTPSFNLSVEHLSQFRRCGNQLHWQLLSETKIEKTILCIVVLRTFSHSLDPKRHGHHSRTERPEMLIAGNKAGARVNRGSIGPCRLQPFYRALISSNLESARSNLALKSHIASRISRKVADVLALSACPKAKMLLFRRYPMIVGSEIL